LIKQGCPPISKYESAFGAERPLTAAQKLAEIMCARKAVVVGESLEQRFWQDTPWDKEFATQIRHANRLLKLYDEEAIFETLTSNPRLWSLGPPWVSEEVAKQQAKLNQAFRSASQVVDVEIANPNEAPRGGTRRANRRKGL
jgi:hypothetical protein